MELKKYNQYGTEHYSPLPSGQRPCGCCGAVMYDPAKHLGYAQNVNHGLTIVPLKDKPMLVENDDYWEECVPVGDEFLLIRHRKVHKD